jgi:hypothetical protein
LDSEHRGSRFAVVHVEPVEVGIAPDFGAAAAGFDECGVSHPLRERSGVDADVEVA